MSLIAPSRRGIAAVAGYALVAGALVVTAPRSATAADASAPTAPVVIRDVEAGADVLPSKGPEQPDTAVEPSIAANPTNARNAVAVYQMGRVDGGGSHDNGFAATFDGGVTWVHGALPKLTRAVGGDFDRASDPVVAFGPDGTVYANSLVFDDASGAGLRSAISINVSHDGGRTWGDPVLLQDDRGAGLNDKNWIVVDQSSAPGHHQGRVYVVWDRVAPVLVNYSDDQGKTWLPVFSVVHGAQGIGAIPVVLLDGSLAVVFASFSEPLPALHPAATDDVGDIEDLGADGLVIAIAPRAGTLPTGAPLVFTPPVSAGRYRGHPVRMQRAADGLPTADVDPATGRIYVAWEDARYRTDLANDVVVTSSADAITWTTPKRVNPGGPADYVDHWNVAIAVGSDHSLRLAYRQRQEDASTTKFSPYIDTYYQESRDQGVTFSPPLRVNRIRTNVNFAAYSRGGAFLGDYNQVAAAGALTYVVRQEAYGPWLGDLGSFPPKSGHQHQTTWVGVVGPASAAAATAGTPTRALPTVAAAHARQLPATGGGDARVAVVLVGGAVVLARVRARRRRPGTRLH
jgi:hypothetical protein